MNIKLTDAAKRCDLSTIIVNVEDEVGNSTPAAIASCIAEAEELVESHYQHLNPNEDPCPYVYVCFARNGRGHFQKIAEISI